MLGRLLLVVSIVAALLAPASAGAAVPTSVIALSSWAPTTDGGVITGGTRTVTLVNATDATTTVDAFDLGPTPCTCRAITLDASHGTATSQTWTVGEIEAGGVATLEIRYVGTSALRTITDTRPPRKHIPV